MLHRGCVSCCIIRRIHTLQQLLERGGKISFIVGLNSVSAGHSNLTPGRLMGDTFAQVATCTDKGNTTWRVIASVLSGDTTRALCFLSRRLRVLRAEPSQYHPTRQPLTVC